MGQSCGRTVTGDTADETADVHGFRDATWLEAARDRPGRSQHSARLSSQGMHVGRAHTNAHADAKKPAMDLLDLQGRDGEQRQGLAKGYTEDV